MFSYFLSLVLLCRARLERLCEDFPDIVLDCALRHLGLERLGDLTITDIKGIPVTRAALAPERTCSLWERYDRIYTLIVTSLSSSFPISLFFLSFSRLYKRAFTICLPHNLSPTAQIVVQPCAAVPSTRFLRCFAGEGCGWLWLVYMLRYVQSQCKCFHIFHYPTAHSYCQTVLCKASTVTSWFHSVCRVCIWLLQNLVCRGYRELFVFFSFSWLNINDVSLSSLSHVAHVQRLASGSLNAASNILATYTQRWVLGA